MSRHPVGKAQEVILEALNLEAETHNEANELFAKYGFSVIPVRQGRKSVPEVQMLDTVGGGWNPGGDGTSYEISYEPIDLGPIKEYMVKNND